MDPLVNSRVRLRVLAQDDLPQLYEFNLDLDANRLAATFPRYEKSFATHWERALADPDVVAKAVLLDDQLAGHISTFKSKGRQFVGYWLAKEFWGQGIANRALQLLLSEVTIRPLHAQVASSNQASLRVLQKCGFVIRSVHWSPADERCLACDEAQLILE